MSQGSIKVGRLRSGGVGVIEPQHEKHDEEEGITMSANSKTSPKLRVAAAGLLAGVAMSVLGAVSAPIASADQWVPGSGPLHPIRHYAADARHPGFDLRHPIRAAVP